MYDPIKEGILQPLNDSSKSPSIEIQKMLEIIADKGSNNNDLYIKLQDYGPRDAVNEISAHLSLLVGEGKTTWEFAYWTIWNVSLCALTVHVGDKK